MSMIWIDITNLPHVLFFKALANKYNALITARSLEGLTELLEMHKIDYISVGKHGKNKKSKLIESSRRIRKLAEIISKHEIKLAMSKHSVELPRVAFGLGIPCLQVVDNEHAEKQNRLFLSLCDKIVVPRALDEKKLIKQGANKEKIVKFNGICEYAHIRGFSPSKPIIRKEYVLVRPEPFYASYFRNKIKIETQKIIDKVSELGYKAVVIPRGSENYRNAIHLKAVDALNLIYHAKAFFGGGGTMNREACLLGTPAISFYPQELLGVDRFLIKERLLFHVHDFDFENIKEILEMKEELRERAKKVMQNMQNPIEVIEGVMHEYNISKERE